MDAPAAESRTFLHRVLRWVAFLALAYGLLQAVSLFAYAATVGFPYYRYFIWPRWLDIGMSLLLIASATTVMVGGWGLLRWRSWGRVVLIVWSVLAILLGLAQAIASTAHFVRRAAATTQSAAQAQTGLMVWSSLYDWMTSSALPVVFLAVLLQPEVAKLWARPTRAGGFDVVPMASAAPTEVVR